MPIDPNIPLQAKNIQIDAPVNQLAMMGEAMKIGEMGRSIEEQNRLNEYLRSGADLSNPDARRELVKYGKTGLAYGKALNEQDLSAANVKKTNAEISLKDMEIAREGYKNLLFNPSPTNFAAHLEDAVKGGKMTPAQAQQEYQTVLSLNEAQRLDYVKSRALKAEQYFDQQEKARHNKVSEGISYGNLKVAQQDLANKYDPTIQSNLAAAKAGGEATGKAVATARINLPDAIQAANDGIRLIDEMVGKQTIKDANGKVIQQGTAPHPGFKGYVGSGFSIGKGGVTVPGQRFVEGTDVAAFDLRQKQIEGKAFLEAFNALKGGGSITEKEGEKGTAAIMRMNKASTEAEYVSAARELQGVMQRGVEKAKAKASGGGAAPAGGEIDFNSLK